MNDQVEASVVVGLATEPKIVESLNDSLLLGADQTSIVSAFQFFFRVNVTEQVHHRRGYLLLSTFPVTHDTIRLVEAGVESVGLMIEEDIFFLSSTLGQRVL